MKTCGGASIWQDWEVTTDLLTTAFLGIAAAGLCILGVALVARYQHVSLWVATPLLLWPSNTVYVQAVVFGVLALGTLIGSRSRLMETRKPILLFLGFAVVMTLGFFMHGHAVITKPDEARNSFIMMLLSVAVIPITALQRPPLLRTLQVLGCSGAAASVYILATYEEQGGRVASETHNPDAIGLAAALAVLATAAIVMLTRRYRWLWIAAPSLMLFLQAQTRSAFVVLTIGFLLLWLLRRASPVRVAIALFGAAAAPFVIDLAMSLQRTLFSERDARYLEVQSRFDVLLLAGRLIVENPISGVGWRHFTDHSKESLGVVINAHNDYALIAAEGGLVAFALFAGLVLRVLTFRDSTSEGRLLRALVIAACATLAFGNLITDLRLTWAVWLLLGIAWSSARNKGRHPAPTAPGEAAYGISAHSSWPARQ